MIIANGTVVAIAVGIVKCDVAREEWASSESAKGFLLWLVALKVAAVS